MTQIRQDVRQFVVDNFLLGQDGLALADDASFLEQGIIDSTGVLELVSFLERRYAIKVEDEDLVPENLDSVDNVVRFLAGRLRLAA